MQYLYTDAAAAVCTEIELDEFFLLNMGLERVISPWLFNLYIDGVVRQSSERGSSTEEERARNGDCQHFR